MQINEAPLQGRTGFNCPHCTAYAQQVWVDLAEPGDDQYNQDWEFYAEPGATKNGIQWRAARCGACQRSSIWLGENMVYPHVSSLPGPHPDMPVGVLPLYEDARAVATVSRRAGAAMARSTLEALLREVLPEATKRTSLMDLVDLAYNKVSSGLGDLLTFIRIVGNSAVHVDEVPDDATVLVLDESTTEAMDAMFAAINEVVDELITKPKQTAKFASLIPSEKMADVRAKRAARDQQS